MPLQNFEFPLKKPFSLLFRTRNQGKIPKVSFYFGLEEIFHEREGKTKNFGVFRRFRGGRGKEEEKEEEE